MPVGHSSINSMTCASTNKPTDAECQICRRHWALNLATQGSNWAYGPIWTLTMLRPGCRSSSAVAAFARLRKRKASAAIEAISEPWSGPTTWTTPKPRKPGRESKQRRPGGDAAGLAHSGDHRKTAAARQPAAEPLQQVWGEDRGVNGQSACETARWL